MQKKINYIFLVTFSRIMFIRHFFLENDAKGQLFIFIFSTCANKNDFPMMFRENFQL